MSRTLSSRSTLDNLKNEAKRWLKAVRAGDGSAVQRLRAAGVTELNPGLRDIQLALAREHGLPGWGALRQALDDLALARRSLAERADIVLRSIWDGDPLAAARILARWPEVGGHDLYTAVAMGNAAEVGRHLAADPRSASRKGGPLNWEPLLYLAYARFDTDAQHSLAIAQALLDRGADPNASFDDGWGNAFTVLTGVIGQGEGDRAPHPLASELATLLLERGAKPFDKQALYNTSIRRDETNWLDYFWDAAARRGESACWEQVADGFLGLGMLDYLLGNAVAYNHLRRAEWLLTHGANANGPHAYSKRPLREEALIYGHAEMARLLVAHGAEAAALSDYTAFQVACMALDVDAARALVERYPHFLQHAAPMLTAARRGQVEVIALLLQLGMNVDVADSTLQRGLHNAAMRGRVEAAKLLIAHGADVNKPTTRYGGPLGFAAHFKQREMVDLLAPLSSDVWDLAYLGKSERLLELFAADPSLVNKVNERGGDTPLFWLPEDEDEAVEMASLLLRHGADVRIRNQQGVTAEEVARQRGLIDAADLILDAAAQ